MIGTGTGTVVVVASVLVAVGAVTVLYLAIRGARYWDFRQEQEARDGRVSPGWLKRARENGY